MTEIPQTGLGSAVSPGSGADRQDGDRWWRPFGRPRRSKWRRPTGAGTPAVGRRTAPLITAEARRMTDLRRPRASRPTSSPRSSEGHHRPFPIQALTIPDALAGRDVCGKAKTGSGKTLAFGLPVLERVAKAEPSRPPALVLVPDPRARRPGRRRARAARRGRATRASPPIYGGADMEARSRRSTRRRRSSWPRPGRLIDLHRPQGDRRSPTSSTSCSTRPTAWPTWASCPRSSGSCATSTAEHQTLLFSATLDGVVDTLVKRYQHDPVLPRGRVRRSVTVEEMDAPLPAASTRWTR